MERQLKDPMGAFFGALDTMKAQATGKIDRLRETALTTELQGFTIDTCNTVDCGWETGVEPTGKSWIIVERYANQELASVGHTKWVETLTLHPETELKDADYNY
jgi:hypothetical protein